MKESIRNVSLLFIALLTTSCSMIEKSVSSVTSVSSVSSPNSSERLCANDEGEFYKCENTTLIGKREESRDTNLFNPDINFQSINEYTEQMAYVLFQKVSVQNIEKAIAVPPFMSIPYSNSGNQQLNIDIAEAIIVDMQNIGLPVAELILTNTYDNKQKNATSYIEELAGSQHFGYVLKGTIGERAHGTMIHAKIIDLETKKVIAATSKFLPNYLVSLLD